MKLKVERGRDELVRMLFERKLNIQADRFASSLERTPLAPDLPTMIEAGVPDYEVATFNGVAAPAGTPAAIVAKLNAAINEGMQAPDIQERLTKLGAVSRVNSPAEFAAFIAAEHAKWSTLAKSANIKVD